jgi:hypothetical protein
VWIARYSPSSYYSTAVSLPNDGETVFMMKPAERYQPKVSKGPYQPTSSDNFLVKSTRSRIGFVVLR